MKLRGLFLILPIFGYCQDLIVSEIVYKGNTFTQNYIISREIQHPLDAPLDSIMAKADRNRLINLRIFVDVNWRAIPLDNKNVRLEFVILENNKFYGGRFVGGLMPGYEEKTGWSFGGGGMFKNFRGRNELLSLGGMIGGKTTFGFSYLNPWITGDHVSLKADIAKVVFHHSFLPYDVELKTVELNMGRFFGNKKKVSLGFEIEVLNFKNDTIKFSYQYFAPMGSFFYDTRDLYANPTKGVLFKQAFVSRVNLNGNIKNNLTWFQSYSIYKRLSNNERIKPWILAWGFKTQVNFGIKDQNFITSMGNSGSVRGWQYPNLINYSNPKDGYRFGFHSMKTALELRKVIIPRIPLVNLYEFGMTLGAFIDMGVTTQNDFKDLLNLKPISGVGITFQFQVPFVEVLRIDYGWGFYEGEQVDRGLHIATQHQI